MKPYIWAEDPRPTCKVPDGGFSSLPPLEGYERSQDYRHKRYGGKAMEKEAKMPAGGAEATTQTIAFPHIDPVVKEQPKGDPNISTALVVGAISGIIGSYFGPAIKNLVQRAISKLFKKGGPDSKAGKEDKEVGCKAHNLKCTIRSIKFSEKIDDLQKKLEELADSRRDSLFGNDNFADLEERINKIEKNINKKG